VRLAHPPDRLIDKTSSLKDLKRWNIQVRLAHPPDRLFDKTSSKMGNEDTKIESHYSSTCLLQTWRERSEHVWWKAYQ
jgi:hypothetical protein